MSKRQILIVLGIWNMLFLFLGFPSAVDKLFALAIGALVILISFTQKSSKSATPSRDMPYVEHKHNSVPVSPTNSSSTPITSPDSSMTS